MNSIIFQPIGVIHSPHKKLEQIPIQPVFARGIQGTIDIFPEFYEGLADLDQFSHIYLFFHFHESNQTKLRLKPYLQDKLRGIFATRAPHRPNKLGMSLVKLTKIEDGTLFIEDVDILDSTPLLDIKPFIKRFDIQENVRSGWQDAVTDAEAAERGYRDYAKKPKS